jgi:hypothetical protein
MFPEVTEVDGKPQDVETGNPAETRYATAPPKMAQVIGEACRAKRGLTRIIHGPCASAQSA